MAVEPSHADLGAEAGEVMAAIDEDERGRRLVLADVSTEEAWLSARAGCAAVLPEWR